MSNNFKTYVYFDRNENKKIKFLFLLNFYL